MATVPGTPVKEKTIPKGRFLRVIFQNFKTRCVDVNASILVPKGKVFTSYYDNEESTYCREIRPKSYRIVFGGGMLREALELADSATPMSIAKAKFGDAVKVFKGLYYHEIGHLRYTDLTCDDILKYPVDNERWSLHQLFNVLEDIVIERFGMVKDFPYTKRYFTFLEDNIFTKQMAHYKDDGSAGQFFNFLLLRMRMGKAFTGTCQLFTDHETDMLSYIKSVLGEPNGRERIKKTIVFFDYLKSLGLKMDIPEGQKIATSNSPFGSPAAGGSGGKGKAGKGALSPTSTSPDGSGVDEAAGGSKAGGSPSGGGAGGTNSGSSGKMTEEDLDLEADAPVVENDCYESFNQVLYSDEQPHVFYDMSYFQPDGTALSMVEALISMVNPQANQIATVIKTYQSRNRLRYHSGKSSGRLHVQSAIAGKPVNIFKKKERIGLMPDLAISVLCDNSGSMGGTKSEICTQAMLSLAVACSKCGVPLEVNAFTESHQDGVSTFRIKRFKDTFENSKKYFGITSYECHVHYDTPLDTFSGNTDEVNLYNVWQEFRKQPWRDKVMIVISDGYTCGSTADLRHVVEAMEADGIYVLAVGVCTDAVKQCYNNYKMFGSTTELEQFPAWLGGVLTNLIKG